MCHYARLVSFLNCDVAESLYPARHQWLCVFLSFSIQHFLNCDAAFDIRTTSINGRNITLCLVSRRSRFRAGTRYFRRGADAAGHVANFNETEQIALVSSPGIAEDVQSTLSFATLPSHLEGSSRCSIPTGTIS